MKAKAVLFDLDGVLVDTEGEYTEFWEAVNLRYPTGVRGFALAIKGNTLDRIFHTYFPDSEVQREIIKMLGEHEVNMQYKLFPGVESLFKSLKSHGLKIAIVTSSSPYKMQNLFKRIPLLHEYVDEVVTDADVTHGKPHPEGYQLAASRLGVSPGECIVAEDSLAGIAAGKNSGARVVAIATTLPAERLVGNADIVINEIKDLTLATIGDLFPAEM